MLHLKFWAKKPKDLNFNTPGLTIQEEGFQRTFGFLSLEFEAMRSWEQKVVNRTLATLANEFAVACTVQEELLRRPLPSTQEEVVSLHQLLTTATETVEEKGRIFWDAHEAASCCGFKVLPKHIDYFGTEQVIAERVSLALPKHHYQ